MEDSVSTFPIVFQHESGRARHQDGSRTFVRAHVMARYHRLQRANKFNNATSKIQSTRKLGVDNPESKTLSPSNQIFRERSNFRTVSAGFIEYTIPAPAVAQDEGSRKYVKAESGNSSIAVVPEQKAEEKAVLLEKPFPAVAPSFVHLQLRDSREQDSSKFMEVFTAYSRILEDRQTPLDPLSKTWLNSAFTDLALFHAILFNFSQHLYALCSMDHEKPSLLKHKVDALHQISTRMESPVQACTDTIIASILCLVSHEFLNRDAIALQAHLRGLRQIISVRGGIHMLGLDGTLGTIYLSYELLLATVFKSWVTTISPLPSITSRVPGFASYSYPLRQNIFTLCQDSIDAVVHGFSNESIQLLSALEGMFAYPYPSASEISLDQSIYLILTRDLENKDSSGVEKNMVAKSDNILDSLYLAVSLHLDAQSCEAATSRLVTALKHCLNKTTLQSFWHPLPGALLFCLIVGVAASKGKPERPWFVANLIRLTTGLAFENMEGLTDTLYCLSEIGIAD